MGKIGWYGSLQAIFQNVLDFSTNVRGCTHPATLACSNNLAVILSLKHGCSSEANMAVVLKMLMQTASAHNTAMGFSHPDSKKICENISAIQKGANTPYRLYLFRPGRSK